MIAVIDYGMGNLRSVSKALETIGAKVKVTNNPQDINRSDKIILPGVGAFYRAMENLSKLDILSSVVSNIKEGKPYLGICLGLQLLMSESEEHGVNKGFDIIKGRVKRFDVDLKVPHMGWNQVSIKHPASRIKIFSDVPDNSYFYFVHTYKVEPEDDKVIAGTTEYGGAFVSAIVKDNIWGVQFHPEKSSDLGLRILKNFITINSDYC